MYTKQAEALAAIMRLFNCVNTRHTTFELVRPLTTTDIVICASSAWMNLLPTCLAERHRHRMAATIASHHNR